MFTELLLSAKHCAECIASNILFNPHSSLSHFTALEWYTQKYLFNTKEDSNREEQKKTLDRKQIAKMADINPTFLIITLNVNRLTPQLKGRVWENGFKKTTIQLLTRDTHFRFKDTNRLKVKGWKKIYHANSNQKRAGNGYANIKQNRL